MQQYKQNFLDEKYQDDQLSFDTDAFYDIAESSSPELSTFDSTTVLEGSINTL